MNIFSKILTAGLVLLTFTTGCKKEESPFTGTDNFIKSFQLQKDQVSLHASFTDTTIVVEVPEGFSLTNATASVVLSENASIYPSPDSITNWNEDAQFVVSAHNGTQKTYRYTVMYKAIELRGSVLLQTQAEVEAFGEKGITEISGNLMIGRSAGIDSITSLAPLLKLKSVSNMLTILSTYQAKDLTGLDNLESVGGLKIENLNQMERIALPSLREAGSIYVKSTAPLFVHFNALESVAASVELLAPLAEVSLPVLRSVKDKINLYSGTNNPTLLQKLSLPELVEVGDLLFNLFNNVTRLELPKLETANNINLLGLSKLMLFSAPRLHTTTGTMNIPAMVPLSELTFPSLVKAGGFDLQNPNISSIDMPKLEEVNGDFNLYTTKTDGIRSLARLHTINGTLVFFDLKNMNGLGIPPSLKTISTLTIGYRNVQPTGVISVKGLNVSNLHLQVGFPVTIEAEDIFKGTLILNPNAQTEFPTLIGFKEVDSLGFNGYVSYMDNLEIKGIRKLNGSFWLPNNNIKSFSLPDLEEVTGNFVINHLNSVSEAEITIPRLKKVGGNMDVAIQSTETRTLSFPDLKEVGGNMRIGTGFDTRSLETLNFPLLDDIKGSLEIVSEVAPWGYNNKLTDLTGFAALKKAAGVSISDQTVLQSYYGLQNLVPSLLDNQWNVTDNAYNPTLAALKNGEWIKP